MTTNLPQLLDARLQCLQKLLYASQRQCELVDRENLDTVIGHLGHKQRIIDELMRLERELDPYRGISPENRLWASEGERERCDTVIAESEELLQEILRLDTESGEAMSQQHRDLEQQIKRLGQGGAAAVAYERHADIRHTQTAQTPLTLTTLDLLR